MDHHDHGVSTHTMNCPIESCSFVINVHAHEDEEAVLHIMAMTQAHLSQAHGNDSIPSPVDLLTQIRANLKII